MAMASERGFVALALLLLTGATIALGAWARIRRGERHLPAVTDLTIVATVLAVAVAGAFDAVLLLPVPTLFAWTIVGALASSARPVREIPLTSRSRRNLMLAVAVVGALFIVRAATQTIAMSVFDGGERTAMERAARLDPGSYRIRMLLGRAWARAGSFLTIPHRCSCSARVVCGCVADAGVCRSSPPPAPRGLHIATTAESSSSREDRMRSVVPAALMTAATLVGCGGHAVKIDPK